MSKEHQLDVLVIGDLFFDLVLSGFASWPNPGEEAFAEGFCREVGGGAAITACGTAKLGLKTGVFGSVGVEDGQWILERLAAHGVVTSTIHLNRREPTATTVSVSSKVERAYFTYMGANRALPELLQNAVTDDTFSLVRHVHLACAMDSSSMIVLCKAIGKKGCSISADIGWHPGWLSSARSMGVLRLMDIFFPNEREASLMTGETDPLRILDVFRSDGLKTVALKLGAKGAALLSDGQIMFQEPNRVKAVDTTGAGDCFDAGFLDAWLRGNDPKKCLRAGVACGSLSTRSFGGISSFPTREELETTICNAR